MTNSPRCVVDTNVLISAGLSPFGKPRRVVEWIIRSSHLLSSEATLDEFSSRYLTRKKFDRYAPPEERMKFFMVVFLNTELIEVTSRPRVSPDPDDDQFLALAADGRADYIVTGNTKDFPESYEGIPVVTPAQFADIYGL